MFRDGLNTSLAHKLVEIGEMNKELILEEWYLSYAKSTHLENTSLL